MDSMSRNTKCIKIQVWKLIKNELSRWEHKDSLIIVKTSKDSKKKLCILHMKKKIRTKNLKSRRTKGKKNNREKSPKTVQ